MRINISAPDAWGKISERYRAALPEPLQAAALNVFVFAGAGHAVVETTKSLAQLYPHKKTIAIVTQVDPSFEPVAVSFSQDEFQVKLITPEEAKKPEAWTSLGDDLLFVLASEDDPLTGRITDLSALHEALKGKRVFKILVSHSLHEWRTLERPEPFTAKVLSLTSDRAVLVGGERCKIQPQLASSLFWRNESAEEIAETSKFLRQPQDETSVKAQIENFEQTLPEGFSAYFAPGESRVFDRAVIINRKIDGLSLIDALAEGEKETLRAPGSDKNFETTSGCRWESPRFFDWLVGRDDSDESVRGLVIIAKEKVRSDLAHALKVAAQKIERLQTGD